MYQTSGRNSVNFHPVILELKLECVVYSRRRSVLALVSLRSLGGGRTGYTLGFAAIYIAVGLKMTLIVMTLVCCAGSERAHLCAGILLVAGQFHLMA